METISRLVLTYVVNALWIIVVVAGVACLCARVLRGTQARRIYRLWTVALMIGVFLPLTGLRQVQRDSGNAGKTNVGNLVSSHSAPLPSTTPASFFWTGGTGHKQQLSLAPMSATALLALYCTFMLYGTARVLLSWKRTRSVCHAATAILLPAKLRAAAEQCFRMFGVEPMKIWVSSCIAGPATAGVLHPILIFPEGFLADASIQDFTSALCHELAHIRRRDFFWNLVCELLLMPVCFHPAAMFIKRRIDQSREMACDEMAADFSLTRTGYARSLLNLANKMLAAQPTAHSYTLGLFDADTLEERIVTLLKVKSISRTAERVAILAVSAVLMAACALTSAFSLQVASRVSSEDMRPFVGTWQAKFDGKTFQTIKIENKDGKLAGTANHISIALDPDGNLMGAKAKEGEDQITSAKVEGKLLRFTCTGKARVNTDTGTSDTETTQYEMKLTGADEAEIHPLGETVDTPQLKPWKLERVKK